MTTPLPAPLTGHRSGYASSPPAPAPKAPATPAPPQPARPAVVIPDNADADPDTATALTEDASADDVAAAVARFRRAAGLARHRAERDQAGADRILEAARTEAARIMGDAEAAVQPLARSAATAGHAAGALGERARLLHRAAEAAVTAGQAEALRAALEDEHERLTARAAELGKRRGDLAAQQRALEAELAAAREAGDLDAMGPLRTRAGSVADLDADLKAQQAPVQERLAEIGTGDETFESHPLLPPLAEARRQAAMRRSAVEQALDAVWPDRPHAVAAAGRAEQQAQYLPVR